MQGNYLDVMRDPVKTNDSHRMLFTRAFMSVGNSLTSDVFCNVRAVVYWEDSREAKEKKIIIKKIILFY